MTIAARLCALAFFVFACEPGMVRAAGDLDQPKSLQDYGLQPWRGFSTAHFVLYTTDSEPAAIDTLQRLERLRLFFDQSNLIDNSSKSKLQVIAFNSEKQYDFYRINPGACAFYQRTPNSDFIVMQDLAPEHSEVALHEYTHFVFEHAGFKLPLWLNEGMADLFSSTIFRDHMAIVGGDAADRLPSLQNQALLDLKTLISVDANSPYYREPEKMALFYAQSWAMTHMLAVSRDYSSGFNSFLKLMSTGILVSDAFQTTYHKSLPEVSKDLEEYVRRNRWSAQIYHFDAPALDTPRELKTAQAEADFALAEVLAANPRKGLNDASRRVTWLFSITGEPVQ